MTRKSKNKLVCGVGVNDADYAVSKSKCEEGRKVRCPYYQTWQNMLKRCYGGDLRLKTYNGCEVCEEWLRFSNFRSWMREQQWIEFDGTDECNIVRKQLDKDLLSGGKRGKLYSPDTCAFITSGLNNFLTDSEKSRGRFPFAREMEKKYGAEVNNPFTKKREWLGSFPTPEEAQAFYIARKAELAMELAAEQTDERVAHALINMDWSK